MRPDLHPLEGWPADVSELAGRVGLIATAPQQVEVRSVSVRPHVDRCIQVGEPSVWLPKRGTPSHAPAQTDHDPDVPKPQLSLTERRWPPAIFPDISLK
jgi:hypothetical protein